MIAYKLLRRRKDGTLGSLFINRKMKIPIGVWLQAEEHPTKGYSVRKGWHTTKKPEAKHLTSKKENRVWAEVQIKDYYKIERPKSQGGIWYIADRMKIKGIIKECADETATGNSAIVDEQRRYSWIKIGTIVDYHAIIGGTITKAAMVVRRAARRLAGGQWVCWLHGKSGCVSCDAVTPQERRSRAGCVIG